MIKPPRVVGQEQKLQGLTKAKDVVSSKGILLPNLLALNEVSKATGNPLLNNFSIPKSYQDGIPSPILQAIAPYISYFDFQLGYAPGVEAGFKEMIFTPGSDFGTGLLDAQYRILDPSKYIERPDIFYGLLLLSTLRPIQLGSISDGVKEAVVKHVSELPPVYRQAFLEKLGADPAEFAKLGPQSMLSKIHEYLDKQGVLNAFFAYVDIQSAASLGVEAAAIRGFTGLRALSKSGIWMVVLESLFIAINLGGLAGQVRRDADFAENAPQELLVQDFAEATAVMNPKEEVVPAIKNSLFEENGFFSHLKRYFMWTLESVVEKVNSAQARVTASNGRWKYVHIPEPLVTRLHVAAESAVNGIFDIFRSEIEAHFDAIDRPTELYPRSASSNLLNTDTIMYPHFPQIDAKDHTYTDLNRCIDSKYFAELIMAPCLAYSDVYSGYSGNSLIPNAAPPISYRYSQHPSAGTLGITETMKVNLLDFGLGTTDKVYALRDYYLREDRVPSNSIYSHGMNFIKRLSRLASWSQESIPAVVDSNGDSVTDLQNLSVYPVDLLWNVIPVFGSTYGGVQVLNQGMITGFGIQRFIKYTIELAALNTYNLLLLYLRNAGLGKYLSFKANNRPVINYWAVNPSAYQTSNWLQYVYRTRQDFQRGGLSSMQAWSKAQNTDMLTLPQKIFEFWAIQQGSKTWDEAMGKVQSARYANAIENQKYLAELQVKVSKAGADKCSSAHPLSQELIQNYLYDPLFLQYGLTPDKFGVVIPPPSPSSPGMQQNPWLSGSVLTVLSVIALNYFAPKPPRK